MSMYDKYPYQMIMTTLNKINNDIVYKRISRDNTEWRFYKGNANIFNKNNFILFPSINIIILKQTPQVNFDNLINLLKIQFKKHYKIII